MAADGGLNERVEADQEYQLHMDDLGRYLAILKEQLEQLIRDRTHKLGDSGHPNTTEEEVTHDLGLSGQPDKKEFIDLAKGQYIVE